MAGTILTRDLYDRMVTSFRKCPGNFSRCADELGVDRRMTTRAWRQGWPRYSWARSIESVLADEKTTALAYRTRVREAAEDHATQERDKAREAAIAAQSEEYRMVEMARKAVIGALVISIELLPAMRTLAKLVSDSVKEGRFGKPGGEKLAMELISRHAALMGKAAQAADAIVKLSRLDRGAPTAHVGLHGANGVPMPGMSDEELTYERALEIVENSADILEEVARAGVLPADLALALGVPDDASN